MQNTSTTFRNELNNDNRRYIESCTITLADGTKLPVDNSQIWNNGFKVEEATSSDNNFDIGAAITGKFTLILNNIYDDYSDYDFTGAVVSDIRVGLELPDETIETVKKGIYTVDDPRYNGSIITLECLDNMARFDQPYTLSKLTYPATLGAIVRDACSCCEVQLAPDSAAFEMDDYVVDTRPDDKSTFREILSYVGQISCHWCKCNANGQLSLGWYDMSVLENEDDLDGGKFDGDKPYSTGDNADGGNFKDYSSGDDYDGGDFKSLSKFHQIHSLSSMTVATDDVTITGIRVIETAPEDSEEDDITYQAGEDDYVLTIEDNKLIQGGKGALVASYLGSRLIGMTFRPFSVSCLSDPAMEAGDCAYLVDRKGNRYRTVITETTFQAGNYQKVSCGAESPARNSATRPSKATQTYRTLRRQIKRNKTEWEKAMEDLGNRLEQSSGLYSTIETQQDGSKIYYLHDKPILKESAIVWKMTAEAWGVSTDGGDTWNGGMTVDGDVIARILHTIGLNADWINTGALVVRDNQGNILFNADIDTGRVEIVADSFSLRGKTIEELAQDELNDFVNAVYGPDIEELQAQIDGQIESFYYDYEPSLQNHPASQWTTTELRKKHEGDIFYWKSKGYAYRFLLDGATWKWQIIQDADITKAIASAEHAQDTADGKRRVFVVTPQPPYDIGDLWAQGSGGDMMRCRVSRSTGTYVSTDWEKASKYTDDTNLNTFLTGEFAETVSDLQAQADKKAETWYQSADPALNWNTAQKAEHKGDLWYDTSRQRTYRYNGSGWDESKTTPPDSVFDAIDGKAQIFVAQPIPPYEVGDLWVTSVEDKKAAVKICKVGRETGNYNADDWIDTKYVDASDISGAITEYDTSLGQSEVFNKLTNGGSTQGIFIKDGKIYLNIEYVLAGVLAGNFINAKGISVKDSSNNTTFYIDDAGNVTIRAKTFSLSGQTIGDIAYGYADNALSSANAYTDSKLANIKPNLSQQEIFNILTNNGDTQGIYLYGGKVYINASYIDTGNLAGWTVGQTSLSCTAKRTTDEGGIGTFNISLDAANARVQTSGPFSVYGGDGNARIEGCKVYGDTMECVVFKTRSQGSSTFNHTADFNGAATFKSSVNFNSTTYLNSTTYFGSTSYMRETIWRNNSGSTKFWFRPDYDNGRLTCHAIIESDRDVIFPAVYNQNDTTGKIVRIVPGGRMYSSSSSAKKYKNHVRDMTLEEAEVLYNLPVVWFQYKEGYLVDSDERISRDIPGMYADDVDKIFPIAADHVEGEVEDWNERMLFPVVLKLVQEQKKEIDALKKSQTVLEQRIAKLESLIGGVADGD
ncbi:MAG: hypothetical protein Q4D16_19570 [Eubacteriales bacterium]|nr:hypothetical protein [Eubacteriales bacterium]